MSRLAGWIFKISVALYLIVNGILGIMKDGELKVIISNIISGNNDIIVIIAGVIALIAGIAIVLEMLNIGIPGRDMLVFVIAIIWAIFVILKILHLFNGFSLGELASLAVYLMVLASLLEASHRFS